MKSHGCFRKIENNIPLCLKHKQYVFLELFIINFEEHFDIFEDISLSSLEIPRFNCEHGLLTHSVHGMPCINFNFDVTAKLRAIGRLPRLLKSCIFMLGLTQQVLGNGLGN